MRTFLLHIPQSASCDVGDLRKRVIEENTKILLGNEFPATVFINVRDLIGDPNVAFSAVVCAKLAEAEILERQPWCDAAGNQLKLDGEWLWYYTWGNQGFVLLSTELLEEVAWDLRHNHNFAHVSIVDDSPEESLDETPPEEYDSSTNDAETITEAVTALCNDEI